MLRNGIIFLTQNMKNPRYRLRFVGNLSPSTSCDFYYDDVITMTSLAPWTQSVSAVFYPSYRVLKRISSYEKMHKFNKQTHMQSWNS